VQLGDGQNRRPVIPATHLDFSEDDPRWTF
jgi:hypothetical protein